MYRPGTVDEMKATIGKGGGFAKANMFYVLLPISGADNARYAGLLCTSVSLPSRQLQSLERNVGIDRRSLAYAFSNDPVAMNFRVLNDQRIRVFFEDWQNSIVVPLGDGEGDYAINFPREYVKPVHIYQLRRGASFPLFDYKKDINLGPINFELDLDFDAQVSGKSTYHWVLEDAYPVTFQQETLNDGSTDISEITVEFAYRRWKGEKMNSKGDLGITGGAQISTNLAEKIGNKVYDILG